MDWAVTSQPRPEIRQAAAALAYNYILVMAPKEESDSVSDEVVSLLCASLEGLESESDGAARLRRVLVSGRILRPVSDNGSNKTIRSLMLELGFADILRTLVDTTSSSSNKDDAQCHSLAKELIAILSSE